MTVPLPPLTDAEFAEVAAVVTHGTHLNSKARALEADARWHRAELAQARSEIERLREALVSLERSLLKDSRQKSIVGDDTEYHLDGNSMYHAINKVRAALAPEGKEGG